MGTYGQNAAMFQYPQMDRKCCKLQSGASGLALGACFSIPRWIESVVNLASANILNNPQSFSIPRWIESVVKHGITSSCPTPPSFSIPRWIESVVNAPAQRPKPSSRRFQYPQMDRKCCKAPRRHGLIRLVGVSVSPDGSKVL